MIRDIFRGQTLLFPSLQDPCQGVAGQQDSTSEVSRLTELSESVFIAFIASNTSSAKWYQQYSLAKLSRK